MKKRLVFTKILVITSILCAGISLITIKTSFGEVYPFFYWKLYSQPAGNASVKVFDHYRLYAQKIKNTPFERIPIQEHKSFTKDDQQYFLRHYIPKVLENPRDTNALSKLKVFAVYIAPDYQQYKIVKESYELKKLLENRQNYDTTTVFTLP